MNEKLNVFFYVIFINGHKYNLYAKKYSNLANLINFLHLFNPETLPIIEYNGRITNKINLKDQSAEPSPYLKDNDKIEIITIVGGG